MQGLLANPIQPVILIMGVLLFVAHASWWIGRFYFPNANICQTVHKNQPRWYRTCVGFLKAKPTGATVVGFFATPLWPCFVFLNVLLLAQVFEMFFPGGARIPFPWVGTYSVFPLIMGVLYAGSQMAFGIMHGHSEKKSGKALLVLVICITIIVEMGLAYYRARLLSTGEEMISPTMWDKIMLEWGPVLAGLLGFIVPIAEITLGRLAFMNFIEPMAPVVLRWAGGFLGMIGTFIAWILFGFHHRPPIILLHTIAELRNSARDLERKTKRFQQELTNLVATKSSLQHPPNGYEHLQGKFEQLDKEAKEAKAAWENKINKLLEAVKSSGELSKLQQIEHQLRDLKLNIQQRTEKIQTDIELIGESIDTLRKELSDWTKHVDAFDAKLLNLENSLNALYVIPDRLKRLAQDINAAWQNGNVSQPVLTPAQKIELQELHKSAEKHKDEIERKWARDHLNYSKEVVNEVLEEKLPVVERVLNDGKIQALRGLCENAKQQAQSQPKPAMLNQTEANIIALDKMIARGRKISLHDIKMVMRELRSKRSRMKALPRWLELSLRLLGYSY